jgi:hypothetical protein
MRKMTRRIISMSKDFNLILGNIGKSIMNTVAMGVSYNWSKEFSFSEAEERFTDILKELKEIIEEEAGSITALSEDNLKTLGFKLWDEKDPLYLIPLWLYTLIPDGTELTSISGDKAVKGTDSIDLDVRFGCIAWGFYKNV